MTRLFEITDQYRGLLDLEDSDDIPPEVIADTLEGLEGDFEQKSVAVAKFILSLEATATSVEDAADKMNARAKRLNKRAESIRQYLLLQFQAIDKKKIETDELVISRRKNPPALYVTDDAKVPDVLWFQPPPPPKRIDKDAIKDAIKAGTEVTGCYLESAERIDIRL
jgi:Siphovirus Gp157